MAAVVLGLRLALGMIFIVTGSAKILALDVFTTAVRDYKLLPESAVRVTAVVLSVAELACGALLVIGWHADVGAAVTAVLLLSFAWGMAVNLIRGRKIDCGCLSVARDRDISWQLVLRNLILTVIAVGVLVLTHDAAAAAEKVSGLDGVGVALTTVAVLAGLLLVDATRRMTAARAAFQDELRAEQS